MELDPHSTVVIDVPTGFTEKLSAYGQGGVILEMFCGHNKYSLIGWFADGGLSIKIQKPHGAPDINQCEADGVVQSLMQLALTRAESWHRANMRKAFIG